MTASREKKASDSNGRYQNMRRYDERDDRQIFNVVTRQKDCTPETWRNKMVKVIYKRVTWSRLETTAPFVHDEHCTNYVQHCCTTGSTPGMTVNSQPTREGFDALAKHWIIWQRTGCWNRDVGNGVSNVDRNCGLHESIRHDKTQIVMECALRNSESSRSSSAS